jgi:rsbT co-antagonist protein RsbR
MSESEFKLSARVLREKRDAILARWLDMQLSHPIFSRGKLSRDETRLQCSQFLDLLATALAAQEETPAAAEAWGDVHGFLDDLSRRRAHAGFSSDETATFIFSLKRPLFEGLRDLCGEAGEALASAVWKSTEIMDALGLHTIKSYQRSREEIISRQQEELLELSTPVVKLWDGILALPMIGTLDSTRTQIVMETLLQRIVDTGSEIAIIDITGVPTVDSLVAQHLLKTVTALRLMGAECIISGIRPQIAQTIVHLGVDLESVTTRATLADALKLALKRSGVAAI